MIRLHPFEQIDFDRVMEWATDARFLMQWAGPIFSYPLDREQLEDYLAGGSGNRPKRLIWKGIDEETGAVIGHIEIDRIDHKRRYGALSRVLIGIPGLRGRGLGRELVSQALKHAFETLDLEEITLAVFDFNHAAIRCYEACGFEAFHTKKSAVDVGEERWGVVFMRLTKNRWHQRAAFPGR